MVTQDLDMGTALLDGPAGRDEELLRVIHTYNGVTDRLRQTHETLTEEVRRLQDQLASANEALQRSRRLAALGEMAAGIAHEVRNPLGSIQLYARMLEQDLTDRPEQRQIASRIAQAVRDLNGVVGDVLTFAQDTRVNRAVTPLLDTVEDAVKVLWPTIEAAGVEVVYDVEDPWLAVSHDAVLLRRALVNLLRNAVDAMPGGGRITVCVRADGAMADIIVRDTGPGIEEDAIDRIFNPFFTTRATGTGLGLAIVHRALDAHGGTVTVHNDNGAVFTLSFPTN